MPAIILIANFDSVYEIFNATKHSISWNLGLRDCLKIQGVQAKNLSYNFCRFLFLHFVDFHNNEKCQSYLPSALERTETSL